jgi:hypothetical protein
MNAITDPSPFDDAILSIEEPDGADEWSLDELDQMSALDSLRSERAHDDGR